MIIGVPAETAEGERRVALVPNHDRRTDSQSRLPQARDNEFGLSTMNIAEPAQRPKRQLKPSSDHLCPYTEGQLEWGYLLN